MEDITYTKGLYSATASVVSVGSGQFRGMVVLARDEGGELENTAYEVEATSATEEEALEEAKALAHRILGEIEF
jgi:hypothetical protein